MLMFCEVTNPRQLWDVHWESLSDDIEAMPRCECGDPTLTLSEDALKDRALYEIDLVLMRNGHRLEDFPTLPKSNYIPFVHGRNRLVQEELAYDQHSLTTDADDAKDKLNEDQRNAYETILNAVTNKEANCSLCMAVVEPAKHLFGQHFCPVYEGKAKSCLQLPHQESHLCYFQAAEPPIQDSRFRLICTMSQLATSHNR